MVAWGYEFYFLVLNQYFTTGNYIHILAPPCNIRDFKKPRRQRKRKRRLEI